MITNFTVGPAKLYHGVESFLCECLQNGYGELGHRSAEFSKISEQTIADFRKFFEVPQDYRIFYTYSATEGLELATKNCVTKNVTHVSNGNFGTMWAGLSQKTGKTVQKFSLESEGLEHGQRVDLQKILPEISEDLEKKPEMVCITANETASGVAYSPSEIFGFSSELKQKFSGNGDSPLLAVDITSGMGGYAYDFSSADIWAFSVQKALGLPAGLGILIVSEKAYQKSVTRESEKKSKGGKNDVGAHHSFSSLEKKMNGKFQTPTTPNFLGIAGLGYIARTFAKDFGTVGNLEKNTREKAENFYEQVEKNSETSGLSPLVTDKKSRSTTILVLKGVTEDSEKFLEEKFAQIKNSGIQIGKGYGGFKPQNFRVGNFPVHGTEDLENVLKNL